MTCSPPLIPCFDSSDTTGRNTCSITKDVTSTFHAYNNNNLYAIVDSNGYPINSNSITMGYSESTRQNLVGCVPNSLGKGSGSCYDNNGDIINGYRACTETECKPVIYDNSFPLNQCSLAYVTIEGNYQPFASCTNNKSNACKAPECNPPCVNGGVCTTVDNKTFCDCSNTGFVAKDCFASCRTTPIGRDYSFRYTGSTCEIPPPPGLPDGFVTYMNHWHSGEPEWHCNSNPLGESCQNGEMPGITNYTDGENCLSEGRICGTDGHLAWATGADQGLCNC